jgi:hypothetical protein
MCRLRSGWRSRYLPVDADDKLAGGSLLPRQSTEEHALRKQLSSLVGVRRLQRIETGLRDEELPS